MYETLPLIQKLANERFELYLLAGKQHLSPAQQQQLEMLNARLPMLWDEHRREVAAAHTPRTKVITSMMQVMNEAA